MKNRTKKQDRFTELMREHHNILRRIAGYYVDSTHEQKDLYQEILYQLWRSFDDFNEESAFSTWLYRVAVNTSISYLRKTKNEPTWKFWQDGSAQQPTASETDHLIEQEEKQLLQQHIQKLDELDQTVVLLYLEELEYQTIAEITGLSSSNVGVRLHRIRKKLKTMIEETVQYHGS